MKALRVLWSSTDFTARELTRYAGDVMRGEARQGIFVLGLITALLMSGFALLYYVLGMQSGYQYTFAVLSLLALHVGFSARRVNDVKVLYLLAMVLLAVSGLACALLAHQYGHFTATLLSTVVLLFMVVPLVPWGLREALLAVAIVYTIFTGSSLSVEGRFPVDALWTLQFLMVSAAIISLSLVCYAIVIRKGHVEARFQLTAANEKLAHAAVHDPLTGAWNRRFLDENFDAIVGRYAAAGHDCALGIIDVDNFKRLNDTYGHAAGDHVLQEVVKAFIAVLEEDEYVVRLGGDEFVLVLKGLASRVRIERAVERLRACTAAGLPSMPTLSIGIAYVPSDKRLSLAEIYLLADKSLYEAKAGGRARIAEAPSAARAA